MEQNEKNQDLIDLSKNFEEEVENMRIDEAPVHLNNNESSIWLQGYQTGFQAAIEFINKNKNN
jgi:hypothetical protein